MSSPTYDQLAALRPTSRLDVGPEHIDVNGHMNIRHYFDLGGLAIWERCRTELGMGEDYIGERGMSSFTAEQHLAYRDESREGDRLEAPVLLVDRGDKSLHVTALIVNHTRQRLACVMESVLVHVDFTTRRAVPFPDDVAALLDAAVASDRPAWDLPLSGGLGVRR